jgi:hypothetical protein
MIKFAMALAAASMLAAPAALAKNANGNGKGQSQSRGVKVCLVTFADSSSTLASNVINARYLPLAAALQQKARNMNDAQLIVTYGATGATSAGIDAPRVNAGSFNIKTNFTFDTTTEEACTALEIYAERKASDGMES